MLLIFDDIFLIDVLILSHLPSLWTSRLHHITSSKPASRVSSPGVYVLTRQRKSRCIHPVTPLVRRLVQYLMCCIDFTLMLAYHSPCMSITHSPGKMFVKPSYLRLLLHKAVCIPVQMEMSFQGDYERQSDVSVRKQPGRKSPIWVKLFLLNKTVGL